MHPNRIRTEVKLSITHQMLGTPPVQCYNLWIVRIRTARNQPALYKTLAV